MVQVNPPAENAELCGVAPGVPEIPLLRKPRGKKAQAKGMDRLVRTVEAEIVPRLLIARRNFPATPVPANAEGLDEGDAAELARLLLSHEVDVPFAYVEAIRHRGVQLELIYTQLLAPAARRLGVLWERDEVDFVQVTLGLGRLHQLLQRLSTLAPKVPSVESRGAARRALFATVPDEDHSFGLLMVTQFFRQNGWDVWNEFPESAEELVACVSQNSFSMVGLSAGSLQRVDQLTALIRRIRRASQNPLIGVMVGGPVFLHHPELAARVGADATAADGHEAARRAESMCALLTGEK
jgi:methanogenic corrinoid protein MtbC1